MDPYRLLTFYLVFIFELKIYNNSVLHFHWVKKFADKCKNKFITIDMCMCSLKLFSWTVFVLLQFYSFFLVKFGFKWFTSPIKPKTLPRIFLRWNVFRMTEISMKLFFYTYFNLGCCSRFSSIKKVCKTTESYLKSHDEKKEMCGCCKHWQTNRHNAILLFVCEILTKIHTFL